MEDDLHDGLLHTLYPIGRNQHLDARLVLAAEPLRRNRDVQLVSRNDFRIDDARRIVLRIHAVEQRLRHDGLAKVSLRIALRDAFIDSILQIPTRDMKILPDLQEHDGHARILAIRTILRTGDLRIPDDLVEHVLPDRRFFCLTPPFQPFIDILWQIICRFLAHLCHGFRDLFRVEFSQSNPSHKNINRNGFSGKSCIRDIPHINFIY